MFFVVILNVFLKSVCVDEIGCVLEVWGLDVIGFGEDKE